MFLPVIKPLARTILRVLSFILFAITVAAAFGGRVNPEYTALPGVAVMAMPYLAVATIIVTVLWFLAGRWITGAIGVVSLIAAWAPISGAVPLHSSNNPAAGRQSFSLMTWNILHTEDQNTPREEMEGNKALEYVLEQDADIVCMQEIYDWNEKEIPNFTPELQARIKKKYPYSAHPMEGYGPNYDTFILSKYPVRNITTEEWKRRHPGSLKPGEHFWHFGLYEVNVDGNMLLLANVHLFSPGLSKEERGVMTGIRGVDTAKASAREFKNSILGKIKISLVGHSEDLGTMINALQDYRRPIVVCGDFNDVPESYALRKMEKAGYKSVYAEVGFGPMVTYNKYMMWFQLDHVLYRGSLRPLDLKKGRIKTSDHFPLLTTFEFI